MTPFDKSAGDVLKTMNAWEGQFRAGAKAAEGLLSADQVRANVLNDMKSAVRQLDAFRKGGRDRRCVDLSFDQFAKLKFGFSSGKSLMEALGVDYSSTTLESLSTMPEFDEGYRWLIPEVIRTAVRLGLRRNPVYPDLIAGEESVNQRQITLPHVNLSAATPENVGENETIPVGTVSFGERSVKIKKIGTGLRVSDEVQKYVSLNILALYLQDVGVKMGMGMDTLAIDALVNGDDSDDAFAAPVIGVETTSTIAYRDLLRAWLRLGRIGRTPTGMISNEGAALDVLLLDEFRRWSPNMSNAQTDISLKTPVPQSQDYYIHGAMPSGTKLGLIDKASAMIKLNATGLLVESERIAQRQITGTYVTQTTGFARLFRDAFLIIDASLAFSSNGFPAFMDVDAEENVVIE